MVGNERYEQIQIFFDGHQHKYLAEFRFNLGKKKGHYVKCFEKYFRNTPSCVAATFANKRISLVHLTYSMDHLVTCGCPTATMFICHTANMLIKDGAPLPVVVRHHLVVLAILLERMK